MSQTLKPTSDVSVYECSACGHRLTLADGDELPDECPRCQGRGLGSKPENPTLDGA
jgi:rubrerythrin